jgi:hypothetical protein
MAQGLKISELPKVDKNNLETGDLLVIAEKIREGVYATKQLNASYILKLKTEADNAGSDDGRVQIYKNSTTSKQGTTVLNFRGLKAGTDIVLTQQTDNILIDAKVDGENTKSEATNVVGIYAGKNTSNSNLKFKSISGEKGITCRSDSTGAYVSPKSNHYFLIPANPSNPSSNPNILTKKYGSDGYIATPDLGNYYTPEWSSGTQEVDLSSIIDTLPSDLKESLNLAEKGLAFVRIRLNVNSTDNIPHYLSVKSTEDSAWNNKISLDPTGSSRTTDWEGEDALTTIVEFNKTNKKFNWRVMASAGNKDVRYWQINVHMYLEGFFV